MSNLKDNIATMTDRQKMAVARKGIEVVVRDLMLKYEKQALRTLRFMRDEYPVPFDEAWRRLLRRLNRRVRIPAR